LTKLLARRNALRFEFARAEEVFLQLLAQLCVLSLFVEFGFAAAPRLWLVIFTSHGAAPLVHKKEVCGERNARTPLPYQREPFGSVPDWELVLPFCVPEVPFCGVVLLSVASGVVWLVPFCVPFVVVGVVPWIVLFVPFVVVVLESIVAEPLTEPESTPDEPISSGLVLHPTTNPANANAAKNCFIISFVRVSTFAWSTSRDAPAIQLGQIP
jgi:hypothetical protein